MTGGNLDSNMTDTQRQQGQEALDALVAGLRRAYGDGLACVALYGSAAGGEHLGERSDVNVLVIVEALPIDAIERAGAASQQWMAAGNGSPLTLTTAEWRSSADVFAIEYADVLERHKVLHGALPMDGIAVRPEDIRRELEEQVLGKLLKLRRGIVEARGDGAREVQLLEISMATFLALFRAVVRLHGERPPADHRAVVERTGALAGFDPGAFVRVVRHVRGESTLQPGEARTVLAGYLSALERLIAHLDRWAPTH